MNEAIAYPNITDATVTPFRVIQVLHKTHPNLLDRPDCPYSDDTKALLRTFVGATAPVGDQKTFLDDADDPYEALERQIALTLQDIAAFEAKLSTLDNKDRVQFLKAKPALLEKLIELKERTNNMKVSADFMKKIYEFVDKDLDTDRRTALMKRVGDFLEGVQ